MLDSFKYVWTSLSTSDNNGCCKTYRNIWEKNQCMKFHFNGICSDSFVYHCGQNFLVPFSFHLNLNYLVFYIWVSVHHKSIIHNKPTRYNSGSIVFIKNYKYALHVLPELHLVGLLYTRVGTLIVATIYLQMIQNRYMFRSFTVLHCSHQHCAQSVVSDVEVVGYL